MWRFVKIPKIIALLAFLLPWMTVSCSGQKIAEASGAELVVGKIRPLMAEANQALTQQQSQVNYYLVAAILLILIGLALSFLARRYAAAVIATSIAALVAIWAGTHQYSSKIAEAGAKASPNGSGNPLGDHSMDQMSQMAASMIQVNWQIGYWITMLSLVAAAVLSFMTLSDRRTPPVV